MRVKLQIKLDKVLKDRGMTQLDLARLIDEDREKRGIEKRVRTASISELYNNQRKSLNKELIEEIASVLDIADIDKLIDFKDVKASE
ncbi:helix-turn-helix transcriptional regulator [Cytobacillus sp. FSL M8-0252]|uniref:helix-turn-helix domain-containing protein n=1 Tax=Cytobacillus sp. FSL M8-0252 TaxID=2921621 RepID=UPI0030F732D3